MLCLLYIYLKRQAENSKKDLAEFWQIKKVEG